MISSFFFSIKEALLIYDQTIMKRFSNIHETDKNIFKDTHNV